MIKNFNIQDKTAITTYKSYIELETTTFTVPESATHGLLIEINSEFLRNDVSFALTEKKTKKFIGHTRTMVGKRLVVQEL